MINRQTIPKYTYKSNVKFPTFTAASPSVGGVRGGPVLFDNFRVSVQHSALLEETHYYPFGLAMAGISHKASRGAVNSKKFNDGTELTTDLGIDTYETPFRGYDAQLGRFWQVDALAELDYSTSVYTFANNNPVYFNDPWGLQTNDPQNGQQPSLPGFPGAPANVLTPFVGDPVPPKKKPVIFPLEQPGSRIKRGQEPFVKPDFYKVKPNFTPPKDKHNATIGPDWSIKPKYTSLSGSTSDPLGTLLSIVDLGIGLYSEYGYNHKTYKTTKGTTKNIYKPNGAVRSARAAGFARLSRFVSGMGVLGSAVSTSYTAIEVIDAIKAGEEISGWKYADLTVGAAGTASAAVLLTAGTLLSPIVVTTLTIVATGAMIYGGVRLLNDLLN